MRQRHERHQTAVAAGELASTQPFGSSIVTLPLPRVEVGGTDDELLRGER
ncbi:MAG: hypothetical protein R2862_07850 [Thermoanaerobaculia bacterium]